jgi:hypothetical protein
MSIIMQVLASSSDDSLVVRWVDRPGPCGIRGGTIALYCEQRTEGMPRWTHGLP